jgi:hypothetical protein
MIFVGHEVSQLKLGLLVNILNYDDVENSNPIYLNLCAELRIGKTPAQTAWLLNQNNLYPYHCS